MPTDTADYDSLVATTARTFTAVANAKSALRLTVQNVAMAVQQQLADALPTFTWTVQYDGSIAVCYGRPPDSVSGIVKLFTADGKYWWGALGLEGSDNVVLVPGARSLYSTMQFLITGQLAAPAATEETLIRWSGQRGLELQQYLSAAISNNDKLLEF